MILIAYIPIFVHIEQILIIDVINENKPEHLYDVAGITMQDERLNHPWLWSNTRSTGTRTRSHFAFDIGQLLADDNNLI